MPDNNEVLVKLRQKIHVMRAWNRLVLVYLMSLAILYREAATVLRAPLISTTASCAARASNLLGAVTKGSPVSLATAAARAVSKPIFEFSPAKQHCTASMATCAGV